MKKTNLTSNIRDIFSSNLPIMLLVTTAFITFMVGCEDSSTGSHQNTGSIVGFVQPFDQWGRKLNDRSGVMVSLKGGSASDVTNADGRFNLENVSAGVYTIILEKKGFGTMKIPGYRFPGGGQAFLKPGQAVRISKIPDYSASIDSMYIPKQPPLLFIDGALSKPLPENAIRGGVVFYFSKSKDISPDPSNYDFLSAWLIYKTPYHLPVVKLSYLTPGEKYYVKGYTAGLTPYIDPASNDKIFVSTGPSTKTKSIVVPDSTTQKKSTEDLRGVIHIGYDKIIKIPADLSQKEAKSLQKEIRTSLKRIRK